MLHLQLHAVLRAPDGPGGVPGAQGRLLPPAGCPWSPVQVSRLILRKTRAWCVSEAVSALLNSIPEGWPPEGQTGRHHIPKRPQEPAGAAGGHPHVGTGCLPLWDPLPVVRGDNYHARSPGNADEDSDHRQGAHSAQCLGVGKHGESQGRKASAEAVCPGATSIPCSFHMCQLQGLGWPGVTHPTPFPRPISSVTNSLSHPSPERLDTGNWGGLRGTTKRGTPSNTWPQEALDP